MEELKTGNVAMSFNRNFRLNRLDELGGQVDQPASDFQFDWKMTIATDPLMLTANYILWTLEGVFA